jgi:disulfide oxidoreductase YuzD
MKTAVEWLESEMLEHYSPFDNKLLYEAIHKAKEMDKEQSIELIRQTAMFMAAADFDEDIAKMTFEDIYETLKQQEQ